MLVNAGGDDRTGTPADSVDAQAAVDVASGFMAAIAAYDAPRAESYLADDARIQLRNITLDVESVGPHLRWTRAAEFRVLPGRCALERVSAPEVAVACLYDIHGLGSERLGRGPFTGNVMRLDVVDGEIVIGVENWGSDEFETTMWEPCTAWLLSNHADEADLMYDDWPGAMRPALTERSTTLWAKNVDRYVRAVERGNAS